MAPPKLLTRKGLDALGSRVHHHFLQQALCDSAQVGMYGITKHLDALSSVFRRSSTLRTGTNGQHQQA